MATAIVTAGAGARGAYEAGVLSVLLPKLLLDEKEENVILVGTSAGAINTAIIAGAATATPTPGTLPAPWPPSLATTWEALDVSKVFSISLREGVRYVAEMAGLPVHADSVFDTSPLVDTVKTTKAVDWTQLSKGIQRSTWLKAAAVVATEASSGESVVFVDGLTQPKLPQANRARAIAYEAVDLRPEHVLASAAIPLAFPSIEVPPKDWYMDGGVRLNTPISPAADILGALYPNQPKRMIIVSTDPDPRNSTTTVISKGRPDIIDEGAFLLYNMFVDRVAEDVRALGRVNAIIQAVSSKTPAQPPDKSATFTDPRKQAKFTHIEHCYFGPETRREIAAEARAVFKERYPSWRGWPFSTLRVIDRFLGQELSGDEILSFLFFDEVFLKSSSPWAKRAPIG